MPKFRYILLILLFLSITIFADTGEVEQLYRQNDIVTLEKLLNDNKINQPDWHDFVTILFVENSEEAIPRLVELHGKSDDVRLKNLIVDRISQYYYAKGLYNSANKIIEDPEFRSQIFTSRQNEISFGVQVGAFSSFDNASKAKSKYQSITNDIFIVPKTNKGKKLYTVVLGKFVNRDAANQLKQQVYQKLNQNAMIIQY